MATTYTTIGPVRGRCGHRHRTIRGAARCLARDQDGCRKQGGYSDRTVCHGDGSRLEEAEYFDAQDTLMRLHYEEAR